MLTLAGCRQSTDYSNLLTPLESEHFSLSNAKERWQFYEEEMHADVAFLEEKLMKQILYVYGDLNDHVGNFPQEFQEAFAKTQKAFRQYLNWALNFDANTKEKRDLALVGVENVAADFLFKIFYEQNNYLKTELYKQLSSDNPKLSPYLAAFLCYLTGCAQELGYNYKIFVPNIDIFQTSDANIKLISLYNNDCHPTPCLFLFNKTAKALRRIPTPEAISNYPETPYKE